MKLAVLQQQRPHRNLEGCCLRHQRVHLRPEKMQRGASWFAGIGNPRVGAAWRTLAVSSTLSTKGAAPLRVVVVQKKMPPVAAELQMEVRQQVEVRERVRRDGHAAAVVVLARGQQQQLQLRQRVPTKRTVMEVEDTTVEAQQHLYLCLRLQPWHRDCLCIRCYSSWQPIPLLVATTLAVIRMVALQVPDASECPGRGRVQFQGLGG